MSAVSRKLTLGSSAVSVVTGHNRTKCVAAKDRLFDHFVGQGKQLIGDLNSKNFCRLEINHQVEFGRLKNRQVGRLLAFQNASNVTSAFAIIVRNAVSITDQ